jgi:hypothetical protein
MFMPPIVVLRPNRTGPARVVDVRDLGAGQRLHEPDTRIHKVPAQLLYGQHQPLQIQWPDLESDGGHLLSVRRVLHTGELSRAISLTV